MYRADAYLNGLRYVRSLVHDPSLDHAYLRVSSHLSVKNNEISAQLRQTKNGSRWSYRHGMSETKFADLTVAWKKNTLLISIPFRPFIMFSMMLLETSKITKIICFTDHRGKDTLQRCKDTSLEFELLWPLAIVLLLVDCRHSCDDGLCIFFVSRV